MNRDVRGATFRRPPTASRRVVVVIVVLAAGLCGARGIARSAEPLLEPRSRALRIDSGDAPEVETVSPGGRSTLRIAAESCPTYSWAEPADPGVERLVLRVFEARVGEPAEATPVAGADVLEVFLPPGATSWTPPLERCLEPGGLYGWQLERVDGSSLARSSPRWFRVSTTPSAAEVDRAVEIVRRHLESAERADRDARAAELREASARHQAPSTGRRSAPETGEDPTRVGTALASGSSGLAVSGGLEVRGLRSERTTGSFGELRVSGDVTAVTVEAPATILGTGSINAGQTLWAPEPGSLNLCDSVAIQFPTANEPRESPCGLEVPDFQAPGGTVYIPVNGDLAVGLIFADGIEVAADGDGGLAGAGIQVPQGDWTAGGGSGYASVGADGSKVDYDDNESSCPAGTVAIGAQLFLAGGDQIGIRVKCSSP